MKTGTIRFSRILSVANQIAGQLQDMHFAAFRPPGPNWIPAINVYAHADRFEVCVDLAGVEKRDIHVEAEPRRLSVSGHRPLPESKAAGSTCKRILMLEIQDGNFSRTIEFAEEIDTERVEARQENGWLWIVLPMACQEAANE